MMTHIKCQHCGNEDQSKIILSESGPHTKASCGICREFIKFVPKTKKKKHNLF
jgi:uncharacterized Zn finger protein